MQEKIELKFSYEDPGFCRIYFKFWFNEERYLACLQLVSKDAYELLNCSKDGEPIARLKTNLFQLPEAYSNLNLVH